MRRPPHSQRRLTAPLTLTAPLALIALLTLIALLALIALPHPLKIKLNAARAEEHPSLKLIYPLDAPPSLSSSFGTYRINHHHAGLDLYAYEGTPVVAAAAGTLTRVKRGSGGYGRALYLRHEGEFTTLYGHLAAFAPRIEALVRAKERAKGSFELKFNPSERLTFKAGEVIGYAGTSGTDLVHLHFELRHKNAPINPLTHGLTLPDTLPPTLIRLIATPFGEGSAVNGGSAEVSLPIAPRPQRLAHPALALDAPPPAAPTPAEPAPAAPAPAPPLTLTTWGDVRLSLEVEDRVDGSARELTPYEVTLEVDGRLAHHIRYDESTYATPRASELDFNIAARGPSKLLVHRLYRYADRPIPLKRAETSPLKELKAGQHTLTLTARDAAGNTTRAQVALTVEPPQPPPCGLVHKALTSPQTRALKGAEPLNAHALAWRPYGVTLPLFAPCEAGRELQVDVRFNGERAPAAVSRLAWLDGVPALSLDLRKLRLGARGRDPAPQGEGKAKGKAKGKAQDTSKGKAQDKAKARAQSKAKHTPKAPEDPHKPSEGADRSALIWVGLKTLTGEVSWRTLKVSEVRGGSGFESLGARVRVLEEAPFAPYLTAASAAPIEGEALEALKARGLTPVSPRFEWEQGMLPMRKSCTIALPRGAGEAGQAPHIGAFMHDGAAWWWVTSGRGDSAISASSHHISAFALLRDTRPPTVGDPKWDLTPPLGPRLIVPVSDAGSGLGGVWLKVNGAAVPFEAQRAWSRLIYRPLTPLKEGVYSVRVGVKDKAGHSVEKTFKLRWPASEGERIDPASLRRLTP